MGSEVGFCHVTRESILGKEGATAVGAGKGGLGIMGALHMPSQVSLLREGGIALVTGERLLAGMGSEMHFERAVDMDGVQLCRQKEATCL